MIFQHIPTGLSNYTQWPHLVCAQLPGQTSSPVPFRYFREERTTHGLLCTGKLGDHFINGASHCLVLLLLNGLYLFEGLSKSTNSEQVEA